MPNIWVKFEPGTKLVCHVETFLRSTIIPKGCKAEVVSVTVNTKETTYLIKFRDALVDGSYTEDVMYTLTDEKIWDMRIVESEELDLE